MMKPENQVDKKRFEELKDVEEDHRRNKESAIQTAAAEVKELRKREGRSKEDQPGESQ